MSVLDKFRLDGQTAIVTGGNRGIGREIADATADVGANVVVANRDEETGRAATQQIADDHDVDTFWVETDVSVEADVENMVEETVDEFGEIDVLVNNSGVVSHYDVAEMPAEEWQRIFDINVNGVFYGTKHVGAHMIENGGGNIVNMSSISGIVANYPQKQAHYNASKEALDGFTRQVASDWAEHGIRINNIAPGYITTEMVERFIGDNPELAETWRSQMPGEEFAGPEVIAPLAVYLVSDASEYVTGERVVIDGGYTIR
jgi:NAD(P)-dependent dehydrogenase (short-subunit alcohol dehydrogenase family)